MQAKKLMEIKNIKPQDYAHWCNLWKGYLEFYQTTLAPKVYETTFQRILKPEKNEFCGLLAWLGNQPVGLVHYLFHRNCWSIENTCYLQDLFVHQKYRSQGIARQLIMAVGTQAKQNNANVYWLTQENNHTARILYDKIGKNTGLIKYILY